MQKTRLYALLALGLLFISGSLSAQILDFRNKVSVVLDDGTNVILYGAAKSMDTLFTGEYYYLPVGLRLGVKKDAEKTPEFLFMKYTTEAREDEGGVSGALMHFLMEWGLTPEQEKKVEQKLASKVKQLAGTNPLYKNVKNPKVLGAVNVKTDPENSFQIVSAVLQNNKSTPTLVTSGRAPVIPGGKVAVGALLEKNAAQLMASTFEKSRSITDVSVVLRFQYELLMPAVEGRITVNWERVDSVYQRYTRTATNNNKDTKRKRDDRVSDTEVDSLFSLMRETKAVDVQLDNLQPDSEVAKEMVAAFMEYFLRSVSEKEFRRPEEDPYDARRGQKNYNYGFNSYKVDRTRWQQKIQRRTESYSLRVRLPITQEFELVENLASWYDGVRDNEKCVNTVVLNDPTFEHRDIHLILDLDAEEMFGKELNFVTVDVRKRREMEGANDYSKQVTFDKRLFEKEGNRVTLTYSKAMDENPDVFEYKVKWSLRGGREFVQDTGWTQGSWEGVTLFPPVSPTPIRFEADIEDLKELDIRNVTLQTRYYKFGKEVESNMQINVSAGVGYVENNLFLDKDTQGYAYRLIFYHKTKGPLATKWDAELNTGYMFAVIPEELRNEDEKKLDLMIEMGKEVIRGAEGKEVRSGKVLDQFKDLIKTN